MNKFTKLLITPVMLVVIQLPMALHADTNTTILCAIQDIKECAVNEPCIKVTPESVALPDFLSIDLKNKIVSSVGVSPVATAHIERVERLHGKLIMQGGDASGDNPRGGVGWTMALDETSGKIVASGVGDGFALVLFGSCIKQ